MGRQQLASSFSALAIVFARILSACGVLSKTLHRTLMDALVSWEQVRHSPLPLKKTSNWRRSICQVPIDFSVSSKISFVGVSILIALSMIFLVLKASILSEYLP